jgi:hypothetical protein
MRGEITSVVHCYRVDRVSSINLGALQSLVRVAEGLK